MKKKILFLSPLPPPHYGSAMSSEVCLKVLQSSKKFEVKNIKINYARQISDMGKISFSKFFGILQTKIKIRKTLKKFNPDAVYFMPATYGAALIRDWMFVREIRKRWKGKILFHVRARLLQEVWDKRIGKRILKDMYTNSRVIVLGKELVPDLKKIVPKKDIFILPNAIKNEISSKDLEKAMQDRKSQKNLNILFLSNMDEAKGWPRLMGACKILKEKSIDFNCNFVGQFPSKRSEEKMKNFIFKNNLQENIKYLGKKTGAEKNNILKKSSILIFPTEYKLETFGRVIIEAMMFGLPVIASGIATIPTTIQDGETGLILKKNTPEEIAEKIIKLQNENLRQKMGKAARKRFLKEYEMKNYSKKFEAILLSKI